MAPEGLTGLLVLQLRPGHPDFLDLPWRLPLTRWRDDCPRVVEVQRGLSRHEVQFVSYGSAIYAVKELADGCAEREYDMLLKLEERGLPTVIAVGHARARHEDGEEVSLLLTRYLDASLPYRTLFQHPGLARYRVRLLDAMAGLLVRLHLAGFYWGDCSLSNTLFRRDAGELRAFLVDAETTEHHETLGNGPRQLAAAPDLPQRPAALPVGGQAEGRVQVCLEVALPDRLDGPHPEVVFDARGEDRRGEAQGLQPLQGDLGDARHGRQVHDADLGLGQGEAQIRQQAGGEESAADRPGPYQ